VKLSAFLVEIDREMKISDPELEEFRFIPEDYQEKGIILPLSISNGLIPFLIKNNYLNWGKK
jgi:hypothetical protein